MKYVLIITSTISPQGYVHGVSIHDTVEAAQAAANEDAEVELPWTGQGFWDGQMMESIDAKDSVPYKYNYTIKRVYEAGD